MPANATPLENDDFALLAAVWILSCNDEIPEMSHQGIVSRLGLEDDRHLRELLKRHTELFRHGIPASRLATRKDDLLHDRHLPGWLQAISDAAQRRERIEALTRDDFFRNQFRAAANAPKVSIEVLKWGLEHIDRLRKVTQERDDARWRWWQNGLIPVLSIVVTLVAVVGGFIVQQKAATREVALKHYELSYRPRQEAYREFMQAATEASDRSAQGIQPLTAAATSRMESALYAIEPFLDAQSRSALWQRYGQYAILCLNLSKAPAGPVRDSLRNDVLTARLELRDSLQHLLFTDPPV